MTRGILNFLIDLITVVAMATMLATGLLIHFVLPPGSGSRRVLWGYGRHDWGDFHFWLAIAAVAIVLVHVAMHWQWVCAMFGRMSPWRIPQSSSVWKRNLVGVASIAAISAFFVGFVWLANQSVRDVSGAIAEASGKSGEHAGGSGERRLGAEVEPDGPFIQGSMTLSEVAQTCGLSVEAVRKRLDLKADEPADERMGRLAKKYGFSMPDARDKLNSRPATSG